MDVTVHLDVHICVCVALAVAVMCSPLDEIISPPPQTLEREENGAADREGNKHGDQWQRDLPKIQNASKQKCVCVCGC